MSLVSTLLHMFVRHFTENIYRNFYHYDVIFILSLNNARMNEHMQ